MFISSKNEIDTRELLVFVEQHKPKAERIRKLHNYYVGEHDILERKTAEGKPNNRLVNNFAKYIVDMNVGYFIGNPISYTTDDAALQQQYEDISQYNDEDFHNAELAKEFGICGEAYEYLYFDEDEKIRFKHIPSDMCFLVYDDSIEMNPLYGVYYYKPLGAKADEYKVVVADKEKVYYYHYTQSKMTIEGKRKHGFGDVPFNLYQNNTEAQGDFENVLTLIDAYNTAQSNTLNDMDQFTDSYMILKGVIADEEDIAKMRYNRVIQLDGDGEAEWLIKDVNDAWLENYKNRLKDDIHKFSFTPPVDSEGFGGNQTTIAIKMRLLGMEQNRINKERNMLKAIMRRNELICNVLSLQNRAFNYLDIKVKFTPNIPSNDVEMADMITKLMPLLSNETLLSLLTFVENPQEEAKQKKQEEIELVSTPYFQPTT